MLEELYKNTEIKMQKALEVTRNEFAAIRTGRASTALLDRLHVDAYGSMVPLKQVASVSTPDARSLVVTAFDRNTVSAIKKAIETSDLGLTPNIDGSSIRLGIPPLTEERRKDLVKTTRHMAEEARVRVRSSRRNGIDLVKKLEKEGNITEDQRRNLEEEIQKLTDKYVKDIDHHLETKEVDIMKV